MASAAQTKLAQEKAEKAIRAMMNLPENRRCADCTAKVSVYFSSINSKQSISSKSKIQQFLLLYFNSKTHFPQNNKFQINQTHFWLLFPLKCFSFQFKTNKWIHFNNNQQISNFQTKIKKTKTKTKIRFSFSFSHFF